MILHVLTFLSWPPFIHFNIGLCLSCLKYTASVCLYTIRYKASTFSQKPTLFCYRYVNGLLIQLSISVIKSVESLFTTIIIYTVENIMSNNPWPNCLYGKNGLEINSVRSWILKFELCMYCEIYLHHQFYLFRSLAQMLKQIQLLRWEFQLQALKSSFLQFCHALGLKIDLILLLRHFWTLNYPTFKQQKGHKIYKLQSSQVNCTPQDPIDEFIIQKLNLLVVVDFRFISAFVMSRGFTCNSVTKFLPAQFPWIWCKCLLTNLIHSKIFNLTKYRKVLEKYSLLIAHAGMPIWIWQ